MKTIRMNDGAVIESKNGILNSVEVETIGDARRGKFLQVVYVNNVRKKIIHFHSVTTPKRAMESQKQSATNPKRQYNKYLSESANFATKTLLFKYSHKGVDEDNDFEDERILTGEWKESLHG